MLKVLDLFSGIGGFSLGLERTGGFETVAFCEIDPFCQKVLRKHWPDVEIIDNIERLDFERPVDVVTAGFPCQDVSYAGKGAGLAGERTGLFWQALRTAGLVGFADLLLENVAALLGRGMGEVLGALAQVGYDSEWDCIPAASIGAPHIRDRVWIASYYRSKRGKGFFPKEIQRQPAFSWCENVRGPEDLPERPHLYESKLCRGGNGVSERLDAIGNAVVPQIPEIIGNAILASMKQELYA
jgi:DNA (cytosine-5)-methyltransferase 1